MAITNYTELKTSVANWLHRADLASAIPDFIGIAEQRMTADLNARDMEATTNLTLVANQATLATPTDVVESRRLKITSSNPVVLLDYVTPAKLATDYMNRGTGVPEVYTVIGANFEFGPVPDAAYTAQYVYRQRIPALSDSNPTNWLLTKWPYAYLYAALCASAPYLRDDARVAVWEDHYQKAVDDINRVDWFSGADMRVRVA